ncbi:MAG: 4a-hydroxytetrahydrobiopterin dehydratase [Candidatus Levyibacteriota bacterium]
MHVTGDLTQKHCKPCEGGVKPLSTDEYGAFLRQELVGWTAFEDKMIVKDYKFKDFKAAVEFVNKVGKIAESEGHHPDINLHNWNKVTLTLTTHAIGGLSENDFILASKIDA